MISESGCAVLVFVALNVLCVCLICAFVLVSYLFYVCALCVCWLYVDVIARI